MSGIFGGLFKCRHPVDRLGVLSEATEEKISDEFLAVTYHLICLKCGEHVGITYAKLIDGVDGFLSKKLSEEAQ